MGRNNSTNNNNNNNSTNNSTRTNNNMADNSADDERMKAVRQSQATQAQVQVQAQAQVQAHTHTQEQEAPSTRQPGPEKKPSKQSVQNSEEEASSSSQDNPNAENNNEASVRMDWSMEQYGENGRRFWLYELLDIYNQIRFNCGMFVNNGHVQFFIIFLISVNAIMMGIATFDFVKEDPQLDKVFETIDEVFLIIFSVELGLQFIYHGWRLILDGWLLFDLIIIVLSWSFAEVQIIRAFRIFRALRLVTRIKIMKNLILALFGVMPRMAAIGLMLALIFYIFAVMFTQLFKDLYVDGYTDYNYFSGIDWTLFTLFQMMTLDNWATIARQVIRVYTWAWFPIIAFVIITGFIVVNLIIAVICDAISALHKDDNAKMNGHYDDTDSDASAPMEIREQLDCLEEQMEELTRIQARTFHTLQYLTRQMQMAKLKQELQKKSSSLTAVSNSLTPPKSTLVAKKS